ncbi:MAG: alpha/beta fold hydrolase [Acidimicrobiales bacterium]
MSGGDLFVTSWGQGPDVVFLHGLGGSSRYWEPLAAASTGYRATAPDLLGFGRSPSPADARYDVDSHLAALAPHVPAKAVVVAHSAGAILAAALAARRPDSVASLLLIGLPAYPDEAAARRGIGGLGLLARLTVENSPAANLLCETMCRFRPLAIALAPWVVRDLPRSIASDGTRHTWVSYSRTLQRVVVEHRAADDLLAAPMPVTLLHGRNDRAAPMAFVESLVERSGGGARPAPRLVVVDGDHHLAIRCPKVVAEILAATVAEGTT